MVESSVSCFILSVLLVFRLSSVPATPNVSAAL